MNTLRYYCRRIADDIPTWGWLEWTSAVTGVVLAYMLIRG